MLDDLHVRIGRDDRKGRVVVISRPPVKEGSDSTGEQRASFAAARSRHASLSLVATEWLPRAPAGMMDLGEVTPQQLDQFVDRYPDANAFVILTGLPPLSPDLAAKLSGRSLKLVAVCGYGANVRHWLETRALSAAVVPRLDAPPPASSAPKTVMDWFEREFQLLTSERPSVQSN